MVRWLVTYLALVDHWSPDRVGAFRDTFVVLALPCCTETEPDLEDFLALVPSSGLGCGYVGLIVSSWLTLSREGWASAAGGAHPRKAARRLSSGRMGASVCAGLGGVTKGAQICLHGFGCAWVSNRPEIPVGCARSVVACMMVVLIEARRMGRSEVSFPSPYARRASPLPRATCRGRLSWSAIERTTMTNPNTDRQFPKCTHCGELYRPPRTTAKEFPGTKPYGGRGACNACYRELLRGHTPKALIDWTVEHKCSSCGQKMRPPRTSAKDWPGTRLYSGQGKCSACAKEVRQAYPTVRELAEMGHPCIEPCPLPSSKRSNIW